MKLTERLKTLMFQDAKINATFNTKKGALSFVMEQLTIPEYEALKKFYDWLVENNKTFGHGNLDTVWDEYTQTLKKNNINNYVKEYQCPGCCVLGDPGCFSKSEADLSCKKHCPGTVMIGVGTIMLGMPKGFNRLGPQKEANLSIFETYNDFMKEYANIKTKYCVPVWRYVNEKKHTFLRLFNPRTNITEVIIILEDCLKEFTCSSCIEITQEDINSMN
jgi:hypothetical protein